MIIVNGKECWPSRGAATILGVGRNTLLKELRERKVFDSDNIPLINYANKGLFIVSISENNGFQRETTYFSKQGLDFVDKLLCHLPRATTVKQSEEEYVTGGF